MRDPSQRTPEIAFWLLAGLLGVALFVWAFPRAFPLLPGAWTISQSEARLLALEAMRDLGEPVDDAWVVTRIRSDMQLERRLQMLAAEHGPERVRQSRLSRAQICWDVLVYPPGASPGGWVYRAFVSLEGELLMLRRRSGDGADPGLGDAAARQSAATHLARRGFDLEDLSLPGEVRRSENGGRLDLRVQFRFRGSPLGDAHPYGLEVYFAGHEPAGFGLWYEDPRREELQGVFRQRQIVNFGKTVLIYVLLPLVAVPFLRRYHDGQLGVRRGLQFFLLTLVSGAGLLALVRRSLSEGANLAFITRQETSWVVVGFALAFVYLGAATLALMAWSLGELFCRRQSPGRLAAIDALFRLRFDNATVARSALAGTAGGFLMSGALLGLAVAVRPFGAWALSSMVYSGAAGHTLAWLGHLAEAFASVVPLYLFAVFFVPGWLRNRWRRERWGGASPAASWVARAGAWIALVLVAPVLLVLPLPWGWAIWGVVALVPVMLAERVDLSAALLAGVVSATSLAAAPALFADDALLELGGAAALFFATAPLWLSARHLLGGEEFVYSFDDVPPHVRRIAERERQRLELETAAEIHRALLPHLPPRLSGVELAAVCHPASEVGGDFYDVIELLDGRLAVAVGDVAGHGVSSGLVMAMVRAALRVQVKADPEIEAVLQTLNGLVRDHAAAAEMAHAPVDVSGAAVPGAAVPGAAVPGADGPRPRRLLVTLLYLLLDPRQRRVRWASAGHLYPYRISLSGEVSGLETASYPLGVRDVLSAEVKSTTLAPGDTLFLLSDGLVETWPEDESTPEENVPDGSTPVAPPEPFGFARLEASLALHGGRAPADLVAAVLAEVEAFGGERPRDDDLTLLALRVTA